MGTIRPREATPRSPSLTTIRAISGTTDGISRAPAQEPSLASVGADPEHSNVARTGLVVDGASARKTAIVGGCPKEVDQRRHNGLERAHSSRS